jgi:hypothetical protein
VRAPGEILLIAGYELGHQPLAVAWPAAFLERLGYRPAVMDVSVEAFDAMVRATRWTALSPFLDPDGETGPLQAAPLVSPLHGAIQVEDFSKIKMKETYLPAGADWYDFWTGEKMAGGKKIQKEIMSFEKLKKIHEQKIKDEKRNYAVVGYWEKQIKEAQTQIRSDPTHYSSLDRTKWSAQDLADLALIFAHKEPPHHNALLCIGTLMGLRSLQLSYVCDGSVAVMDPWPLDYLPTGQICLLPCSRDALYEYLRNPLHHSDTLLDLCYFRSSLHLHPQLFPHATLERDISMIYDLMERGRVLVGNMLADPYVSKTVRQLAEENEWSVQQQGAFWFVVKD